MDPYLQAALMAGLAGVFGFVVLRFVVPLLPPNPRFDNEKQAAHHQAE